MAFTFDADPASPAANAYVSVADADDYFAGRYDPDQAWTTFDEATKQALIVSATRDLDALTWGGLLASTAQPLAWPRQGVFDAEGRQYPSDDFPARLQAATLELAAWKWTEPDRYLSDVDLAQVESVSVGPLDVKALKGAATFPPAVSALLRAMGPGVVIGGLPGQGATSMRMYL
jgi:hypothetical protein